ncbi:Uncharacterized protein GY17_00002890 [Cryptosporidium hominis]|uniref:Uncharacterized protein n=1 Tax=Cryptosporidium hominis TaxID=237895 RepID=A0ABX5BB47_CRYHO|nr:Uncharacterized protein GY17_00002890 [Cryptosporidium hominis]|eukprot:PPS94188.1 Uncharacterized protein GY17_00002890 [Cryptosporidium hominis]
MSEFYNKIDKTEISTDSLIFSKYSNEFNYPEVDSAIKKVHYFDKIETERNMIYLEEMINNFQKNTEILDHLETKKISNEISKDKKMICSMLYDIPNFAKQLSNHNQGDDKSEYDCLSFESSEFQNKENEINQNINLNTNKYKYLIFKERYHNGNYYDKYGRFCGFFNNGIFHSFHYHYQQYLNSNNFLNEINKNETYLTLKESENTFNHQVQDYNLGYYSQENEIKPELEEYEHKIDYNEKNKNTKIISDFQGSHLKECKQISKIQEILISEIKEYQNRICKEEAFDNENHKFFGYNSESNLEILIENQENHEQKQNAKSLFQIISKEELKYIYCIILKFIYQSKTKYCQEKVLTEIPLINSLLNLNKESNKINLLRENCENEKVDYKSSELCNKEQQNKILISQNEFVEYNHHQFEYIKLINEIGGIPNDKQPCMEEINQDLEKFRDDKLEQREIEEHSNLQILDFENILDFDFEDNEIECIGIKKIKLI